MAARLEAPYMARACLRASCLIVDAVPIGHSDSERQTVCRFLLSLYVVDVLAWCVFKILQFEAIQSTDAAHTADPNGFLPRSVIFVTVLTTLETTIEIMASAAVPLAFQLVERTRKLQPGRLATFCMKAYTASTLCACVVVLAFSPCIVGGAVTERGEAMDDCDEATCACASGPVGCELHWAAANGTVEACCLRQGVEQELCAVASDSACPLAPQALSVALAVVYCVCYCLLNQLGDAAREMAVTQWLGAFEGTELVVPGFASGRLGPCLRGSLCLRTSRRPATPRSLSTHLLLLRFTVQGLAAIIYVGVRKSPGPRLALLLLVSLAAAAIGLATLCAGGGRAGAPSEGAEDGAEDGAGDGAGDGAAADAHCPAVPQGGMDAGGIGKGRLGGRRGHTPLQPVSIPTLLRHHWPDTEDGSLCGADALGGGGAGSGDAQAGSMAHETTQELVLPFWRLGRWEASLTLFVVAARGLPQQASDTVLAYFTSSDAVPKVLASALDRDDPGRLVSRVEALLAPVGALLWGVTLVYIMHKIPRCHGVCMTAVSAMVHEVAYGDASRIRAPRTWASTMMPPWSARRRRPSMTSTWMPTAAREATKPCLATGRCYSRCSRSPWPRPACCSPSRRGSSHQRRSASARAQLWW